MANINVAGEIRAYKKYRAAGMTPEGACAMIGNNEAESDGFYANRLEYLCKNRLKEAGYNYTDESYTAAIDSGKISAEQFLHPLPGKQYGYGIVQWTTPTRKAGLYNLAKERGVSIADEDMQLDYVVMELNEKFPGVLQQLKIATSVRAASDVVLKQFEMPADTGEAVCRGRAARGQKFYDEYVKTGKVEEPPAEKTEIEKIYAVMKPEVGYLEKQTNAYLDDKTANAGYNNYTKYWRDSRLEGMMSYYGYSPSSNFAGGVDWPYCADGVFWSFMKALGVKRAQELLLHNGAAFINCETMYQKAVSAGRIISKPKPGCLALFYNGSGHYHVEFVYATDAKIEYTIGFNTSGASKVIANGGGVCDKRYEIATTKAHYFMPAYSSEKADIPATPGTSVTYLKYGSKGSAVKDMQTKLIALGYSCGSCGADGDFGSGTLEAVKAFQKAKGLDVDGIFGENTAAALNTAYAASQNEKPAADDPVNSPRLFVGEINRDNVDVRTWAGREYGNIKSWPKLNKGNLVDVLDYTQKDSQGKKWYFVRIAGKYHGFVPKKNVNKV